MADADFEVSRCVKIFTTQNRRRRFLVDPDCLGQVQPVLTILDDDGGIYRP